MAKRLGVFNVSKMPIVTGKSARLTMVSVVAVTMQIVSAYSIDLSASAPRARGRASPAGLMIAENLSVPLRSPVNHVSRLTERLAIMSKSSTNVTSQAKIK